MSRKKKNGTTHGINAYPDTVPVDEEGAPVEAVDEETLKKIPLDVESAQVSEQHAKTMKRKAAGEKLVPYSSDYAIRFLQVKHFHPNAKVAIEQEEPVVDESIPGRPIAAFRDYDDFKAYVRQFWKGESATFKWRVWENHQPQWTVGRIRFREDPNWTPRSSGEDRRARRDDPPPPQPQQYNPNPYPPPAWPGYPPPAGYYQQPPPQYAPPAEHEPAPQPQPPLPGLNADFLSQLLGQVQQATARAAQLEEHARGEHLRQRLEEITRQLEMLRAQPQQPQQQQGMPPGYLDWWLEQVKKTLQPAIQPPTPSPTQPTMTPLQQMHETIGVVKALANVNRELQAVMAPQLPEEPEANLNQNSEDSPYHIQPTPLMDIVTDKRTGQRADGFTHLLFNSGKASAFLERAMTQGRGMMKDRSEDAIRMMREQANLSETELRTQERKAKLLEEQRQKQLRDLKLKAEYEERIAAAIAARTSVVSTPARTFQFPVAPPSFVMPEPVAAPPRPEPPPDPPALFDPPLREDEPISIPPVIEPQAMGVPPTPATAGGFPPAPDLPSPSPQEIPGRITLEPKEDPAP